MRTWRFSWGTTAEGAIVMNKPMRIFISSLLLLATLYRPANSYDTQLPLYEYMEFADTRGSVVGLLTWSNGEFRFSGNASQSAKQFFNGTLKQIVDEYIRNQKCEGRV